MAICISRFIVGVLFTAAQTLTWKAIAILLFCSYHTERVAAEGEGCPFQVLHRTIYMLNSISMVNVNESDKCILGESQTTTHRENGKTANESWLL